MIKTCKLRRSRLIVNKRMRIKLINYFSRAISISKKVRHFKRMRLMKTMTNKFKKKYPRLIPSSDQANGESLGSTIFYAVNSLREENYPAISPSWLGSLHMSSGSSYKLFLTGMRYIINYSCLHKVLSKQTKTKSHLK